MNKVVNIYPTWPITRLNPPIRHAVKNVTKPVEDIRICLVARAIVEEVLPDGSVVELGFNNYNKDNSTKSAKIEETKDPVITEIADITPVETATIEEVVETPASEPTTTTETVVEIEQPKPINRSFDKYNKKKHRNRYGNNKPDTDNGNDNSTDSVVEATVSAEDEATVETIDVESIL